MAVSFTDREKVGIVTALRQAAGRCAARKGMRKTTVDELALQAGISKGAFYKFYPSKEHLFLDMLEQWHSEIERRVTRTLEENLNLTMRKRAELILKCTWRTMRERPLIPFCRDDLPFLLRKLPENLLQEHYQSNEDFIQSLMKRAKISLCVPDAVAYATIRILLFSLLLAPQVGEDYEQAIDALIDGACQKMVQAENG
jgi:AcrR family transcriptional regulator